MKIVPGLIVCYTSELTGGSFCPLEYVLPPVDTTLSTYRIVCVYTIYNAWIKATLPRNFLLKIAFVCKTHACAYVCFPEGIYVIEHVVSSY